MLTDSKATAYAVKRIKGKLEPEYIRIYMPNVHFEEVLGVDIGTNGFASKDTVKVYVPTTEPIGVSKGDYLVQGEHPAITNTDELTELKKTNRVYVITGIANRFYGSKDLQHIEIGAE